MIKLKNKLEEALGDELFKESKFSLQVGALYKGKKVLKVSFGKKYERFDLASMTKAIFPAFSIINLYPELINKKISDILPWLEESNLKVEALLTHTSGLPAHEKLFLRVSENDDSEIKKTVLRKYLRSEFSKLKKKAKSQPKKVYSDIGFLLLSEVLQGYLNKNLEQIWKESKKTLKIPLGIEFNTNKSKTAPSEKCSWRKKTLQGEVLDGNAYVLGGVQPHAGLFGSMNDMLNFGSLISANYKKNRRYYVKKSDGFATGFEMPSGKLSNAGTCFSKRSIGHLGFTGTSFWYDPEVDLFVCILSNRTYPDRTDFRFSKFRPVIHDIIYEDLVK